MAVSTCVVSGTVTTVEGVGLSNVTIKAYQVAPTLYTDGTLILNSETTTTTDSSGNWSLTLVETETTQTNVTIAFYYQSGGASYDRTEYNVIIPNTPTANFSDLI